MCGCDEPPREVVFGTLFYSRIRLGWGSAESLMVLRAWWCSEPGGAQSLMLLRAALCASPPPPTRKVQHCEALEAVPGKS